MENNENVKFCKDCDFCRPDKHHRGLDKFRFAKCSHESSVKRASVSIMPNDYLLTGETCNGSDLLYCATNRSDIYTWSSNNECGKQARFFKPKEPSIPSIKEPPAIEMIPEGGKSLWRRFIDCLKNYFDIRE
jgi:hypothetical protein